MSIPILWLWVWLLLHIIRGTKRLNPFFRLHETSEVLWSSPGLSLFIGKKVIQMLYSETALDS